VARYLADTSAWSRSHATEKTSARWGTLLTLSEIALTPPVRLELLYSTRGPADYTRTSAALDQLPQLPLTERDVRRAADVQAALGERAQHRGPKPVDLMIAAVAERNELVVLHYDRHFEAIARVTGQPTEWIAQRGSLD
jgi:predicted nucleic acid-binding protein